MPDPISAGNFTAASSSDRHCGGARRRPTRYDPGAERGSN